MAQKISQMTEQSTASMTEAGTSDFLGGYTATGGNANRKFSLSGLANYFLNKFKMTLGGSSQTVKSAIDALNSKMSFSMLLDRDLNAVVDSVPFAIFLQNNSRNATSERHYPVTNSAGFMLYSNIETWHLQVLFFFNTSHIYFRAWYDNEGIVPDWRVV